MDIALDTSIIVEIERENQHCINLLNRCLDEKSRPIVPFFSYFEFMEGMGGRPTNRKAQAINFLKSMRFIPPSKKTARFSLDLKRKYEADGEVFSLPDLINAGQAIEHNLAFMTSDKQFLKIKELKTILVP
ncbi:MAG: PIN domain-containing protein [Nanoarchaeota archaeon]|nr:MAG: PIN domain-containing protein [Nanoarchaeota archaeon]